MNRMWPGPATKGNFLPESPIGRVLHFVVPGHLTTRTGGYHYDRRMISELRRLGWSVQLHELDHGFPEPDAQALQAAGRVFASLPDGQQVVVDGLAFACLPQLMAEHRRRLKLLALIHHPLAQETGLSPARRKTLFESEKQALAAATGIIVTSDFTADELLGYGIERDQISVVRPGVDLMEQAAGSGTGPTRLLCVGTVTPRKCHHELVRALNPLAGLAWRLDCVGSLDRAADHAQTVLDQITRSGLNDRITMHGELADAALAGLYHQADLLVMASAYEGYGMVYDEAISCGLPVASTRVGAVEQIVPAGARRLVPAHDTEAMTEVLRPLLDSAARQANGALTTMRSAARAARADRRSWQQAGDQFAAAIQ